MELRRPNGLSRRWDLGGRAGPTVAGAVGQVGGASEPGRIFVPIGGTLVLVPGRFCRRQVICASRTSSDGFHWAGPREMPTCLQKSEHYKRRHRSASPMSLTWSGGPVWSQTSPFPGQWGGDEGEVIRSAPAVRDPRGRVLFGPGCLGGSCLLLDKTGFWNLGGT